MGQNKALLELLGQPLIRLALGVLQGTRLDPWIAGGAPELARFAPVLPDQQSGLGPLSGICAALAASRHPYAVFLPVDLPLLAPHLIHVLLDHAERSQAAVALFTREGFIESFPVVLHRDTLASLQASLDSAQRGCLRAFQTAATTLGKPIELLPVENYPQDPHHPIPPAHWFMNLNTPEDFKRAVQHLKRPIA
jgi:molybdopterin-guanine dinucleotide biosynthesis protein A